jgi:hypothetical protein
VVSACGAGSLGILNAELTVSNLPASAAFVPFLAELTARLLGSHQTFDARPCGEPMTAFLPSSVSSIEGLNIDGAEDIPPGKLIEESTGVIWRWASAGPPRLYRVLKGEDAVFALCTATPAEESDLRPIDPDTLKTRLAAGRSAYFQSSHDQKSEDDHLWAWFGVACLICLVLEVGVLRGFRS